ncbi:MAG TPA: antitoxin Xre/MbcA/ParS toxin-binding domain-containing protein [Mucilaginibacter sp.]|jgi:putative toxin-antitoxin system antitoxin component (TIGR02293 family)
MTKHKKYEFADDDEINLTNMVREGLSYNYFTTLSERIQIELQEWADYLHLSERTIQRYKKEGKTFDPIHSEKIILIELLYKKGIDVFGIEENFYTWMDTKSVALGGVRPKDLLDTSFGITMVYDELGRIEHGIFA